MGRHRGGYTQVRTERSPSGKLIEQARFDKNLSIQQVAYKSGINAQTIRHIELFGITGSQVITVTAICEALKLDFMKLIEADTGKRYDGL